jgi:hypothetical protein
MSYTIFCTRRQSLIRDKLISNEVSHQLAIFQETRRFFMTSYLVFALLFFNSFEGLPPKRDVDVETEPIHNC